MAIALTTSVLYQNSTAATSHTAASITVANNSIAVIAISRPVAGQVNSITNVTGGGTWTKIHDRTGGTTVRTELWYWLNTTGASVTTTRTISVTTSSKISTVTAIFSGVSTTTPFGYLNSAEGTTQGMVQRIRSNNANSWLLAAYGTAGTVTHTVSANSTNINTTASTGGSTSTNSRVSLVRSVTTNGAANTNFGTSVTASAAAVWAGVTVELQETTKAIPTYVATDFSEYNATLGTTPVDWTPRWATTSATWSTGAFGNPNAIRLAYTATSANERLNEWGMQDTYMFHYGASAFNDVEMLVKTRATSTVTGYQAGINLRASGATTALQRNIQIQIKDGTSAEIWRYLDAGAFLQLGTISGLSYNTSTWVWIRFRFVGTTWSAKVWNDGSSEPGSWQATGTNTEITTGDWHGLSAYSGAASTNRDWDFVSYAFNGNTAGSTVVAPTLSAPTVTTSAATSVTSSSATGNGNVTADGGATVTERGFVWATTANPTIANSKVVVSGTTGSFTGSMTGLSASTLYNYRAYATNSQGTSYGANTTFTTLANQPPTVALNTTDLTSFGTDTTPTLAFTGTDPSGNDIEYKVEIDTVNTFDSIARSSFVAQIAGFQNWWGIAVNSNNGDVFGIDNNGDLWKQTGGVGSFVNQNLGAKSWYSVAVNPTNGDVYASVSATGDIWKQAGGTGSWVAQSAGTQNWRGIAVNPNNGDVFAAVDNGDIYKQTGGTGSWVAQGAGAKAWKHIAVNPANGDVFGTVISNDVWKQTGGTGSFVAQSAGALNWRGIGVNPQNGDVYVAVNGGDIWKQAGGTGSYVAQLAGTKNWVGLAVNHDTGDVIGGVDNGDIWKMTEARPLLSKRSIVPDATFINVTNGADTHPFTSGNQIEYTVQVGDSLPTGTYYWRVRGIDPTGSKSYGAWATTRSFTINTAGVAVSGKKVRVNGVFTMYPVLVKVNGSWVTGTNKVKINGSWVNTDI